MATYPYAIKFNGEYYEAGEDVPDTDSEAMEDNTPLPFSEGEDEDYLEDEKQYTKTDINKMSTADLQALAAEEGIENAYSTSGGELKKILIEHFGL